MRLLHVPVSEMEEQVRLGTLAIPGNASKARRQQMQERHSHGYMTTNSPFMTQLLSSAAMMQQGAAAHVSAGPSYRSISEQQPAWCDCNSRMLTLSAITHWPRHLTGSRAIHSNSSK